MGCNDMCVYFLKLFLVFNPFTEVFAVVVQTQKKENVLNLLEHNSYYQVLLL